MIYQAVTYNGSALKKVLSPITTKEQAFKVAKRWNKENIDYTDHPDERETAGVIIVP